MAMKGFYLSGLLASAIFTLGGCRFENAVAADRGDAQATPANPSGGTAAAPTPTGAPPSGGVAKPGLWQPLVAAATSWKLINYNIRDRPDEDNAVIVSNYDLRQVGAPGGGAASLEDERGRGRRLWRALTPAGCGLGPQGVVPASECR